MRISVFCLKFNPKFETRQPFFPPYHKTRLCKCYDLPLFLPPGSFSSLLITVDYFPLLFFLPSSFPLFLPSSPIPLSHFSPCLRAPGHSPGVSDPVLESHTWKYASRLFLQLVFFRQWQRNTQRGNSTDMSPQHISQLQPTSVVCIQQLMWHFFIFGVTTYGGAGHPWTPQPSGSQSPQVRPVLEQS